MLEENSSSLTFCSAQIHHEATTSAAEAASCLAAALEKRVGVVASVSLVPVTDFEGGACRLHISGWAERSFSNG
jgi:hypothetical protein